MKLFCAASTFLYSFLIISVPARAQESTTEEARELLYALAEDGSPESYALFEEIMTDPVEVKKLYGAKGEVRLGAQVIAKSLNFIGDRQDEASYELLLNLAKNPVTSGEHSRIGSLQDNLTKYRDDHAKEILDLFESQMFLPQNEIDGIREEYPFIDDPEVRRSWKPEYVNKEGEVVYKGSLFPMQIGSRSAARALISMDAPHGWDILKGYLNGYPSIEQRSARQYTGVELRTLRYGPLVIDIYESIMMNPRQGEKTRSVAVADFFDDVNRLRLLHPHPFQQISDASEEALLRILEVADYALTLDFLPQETRDLVYEKRAEVIDRLEKLGYDSEWLRAEGPKTEVIEEVAVELPTQSIDSDLETTEPEKKSNPLAQMETQPDLETKPTLWWPWALGGVVVILVGIALLGRGKQNSK